MSLLAAIYDFLNKPRYLYREYKTTLALSRLEEDAAVRKTMNVVLFHEPLGPPPELDDPNYFEMNLQRSLLLQNIANGAAKLRDAGYGKVRAQPSRAKKRRKLVDQLKESGYQWCAVLEDEKVSQVRKIEYA